MTVWLPKVDNAADGGPLAGWIQSSGRVAVATVEYDTALVTYDKQGWGGGYCELLSHP